MQFGVFLWLGSVNYGHYPAGLEPRAAMSSVSRPFGAKICPRVLNLKQRGNDGAPAYYYSTV